MNKNKTILLLVSLLTVIDIFNIQAITLDECYKLALKNSTISKKSLANKDINSNSRKEANSVYTPNIALNGIASYQSDVVTISMPGIESPRKENYSVTLDLEQSLYNGGIASKQKNIAQSTLQAENFKIDIEKLNLKDKVSSLFLGISLLKSSQEVLNLNIEILNRNLEKMKSLYENGAAQKSNYLQLESELLKAQQSLDNNKADQTKMVKMLSILSGKDFSINDKFILPSNDLGTLNSSQRPEYKLFNAQSEIVDENIRVVNTKNLPKLSLFATGGNGLPGLNMLNRDPDWYYKTGIKLSVPITIWHKTKYKKANLKSQKALILEKKEDYAKQNKMLIAQSQNDVLKYKNMIKYDKVIVSKKEEIAKIEEVKLQRGIITSSEYITELNNYKQAMLLQKLDEIKLFQAVINYKSAVGKE